MFKWSIEIESEPENQGKSFPRKKILIKNLSDSPIITKVEIYEYIDTNILGIIITASNELSFDKMLRSIGKHGFDTIELDYSDKNYNRFVHQCNKKSELDRLLQAVRRIDFINIFLLIKIKKELNIENTLPSLKEITAEYFNEQKKIFSHTELSLIPTDLHELLESQPNLTVHDEKYQEEDVLPKVIYTCKYF